VGEEPGADRLLGPVGERERGVREDGGIARGDHRDVCGRDEEGLVDAAVPADRAWAAAEVGEVGRQRLLAPEALRAHAKQRPGLVTVLGHQGRRQGKPGPRIVGAAQPPGVRGPAGHRLQVPERRRRVGAGTPGARAERGEEAVPPDALTDEERSHASHSATCGARSTAQ
jgi:hypothetical protein